MPVFNYKGLDLAGADVGGRITALSRDDALERLAHQSVRIRELSETLLSRAQGKPKAKHASVVMFTRMMSSLLKKLTVQEALAAIREDLGDIGMERVLLDVSVALG